MFYRFVVVVTEKIIDSNDFAVFQYYKRLVNKSN